MASKAGGGGSKKKSNNFVKFVEWHRENSHILPQTTVLCEIVEKEIYARGHVSFKNKYEVDYDPSYFLPFLIQQYTTGEPWIQQSRSASYNEILKRVDDRLNPSSNRKVRFEGVETVNGEKEIDLAMDAWKIIKRFYYVTENDLYELNHLIKDDKKEVETKFQQYDFAVLAGLSTYFLDKPMSFHDIFESNVTHKNLKQLIRAINKRCDKMAIPPCSSALMTKIQFLLNHEEFTPIVWERFGELFGGNLNIFFSLLETLKMYAGEYVDVATETDYGADGHVVESRYSIYYDEYGNPTNILIANLKSTISEFFSQISIDGSWQEYVVEKTGEYRDFLLSTDVFAGSYEIKEVDLVAGFFKDARCKNFLSAFNSKINVQNFAGTGYLKNSWFDYLVSDHLAKMLGQVGEVQQFFQENERGATVLESKGDQIKSVSRKSKAQIKEVAEAFGERKPLNQNLFSMFLSTNGNQGFRSLTGKLIVEANEITDNDLLEHMMETYMTTEDGAIYEHVIHSDVDAFKRALAQTGWTRMYAPIRGQSNSDSVIDDARNIYSNVVIDRKQTIEESDFINHIHGLRWRIIKVIDLVIEMNKIKQFSAEITNARVLQYSGMVLNNLQHEFGRILQQLGGDVAGSAFVSKLSDLGSRAMNFGSNVVSGLQTVGTGAVDYGRGVGSRAIGRLEAVRTGAASRVSNFLTPRGGGGPDQLQQTEFHQPSNTMESSASGGGGPDQPPPVNTPVIPPSNGSIQNAKNKGRNATSKQGGNTVSVLKESTQTTSKTPVVRDMHPGWLQNQTTGFGASLNEGASGGGNQTYSDRTSNFLSDLDWDSLNKKKTKPKPTSSMPPQDKYPKEDLDEMDFGGGVKPNLHPKEKLDDYDDDMDFAGGSKTRKRRNKRTHRVKPRKLMSRRQKYSRRK